MDITYTIKAGDSTSSVAKKFGKTGRENELIAINTQIPRRTVYYMGQPQVVFAGLLIGQKIRIPSSWVNRSKGYSSSSNLKDPGLSGVGATVQCPPGYVYNAKMGVCMPQSVGVGRTVQCPQGYVYNAKMGVCVPQGVGVGRTLQCPPGYVYNAKMGVCVPQGVGVGFVGDDCYPISSGCNSNSECCSGYCNTNVKGIPGSAGQCQVKGVKPPAIGTCKLEGSSCNKDGDCCSSNCENGVCVTSTGKPEDIANVEYPCTTPDIIEQVYTNLGTLYPGISGYGNYGEWNEALQAALEDSGMSFQEAYSMGNPAAPICTGEGPTPVYCPDGQDFNLDTGKCEVIGGGTKKPPSCATGYQLNAQGTACVKTGNGDITPVVDKDEVKKEEEGGFPWGWAALGAIVVVGGGTAIYFATKKPDKSKSLSPAEKKPVTVSERIRRHY